MFGWLCPLAAQSVVPNAIYASADRRELGDWRVSQGRSVCLEFLSEVISTALSIEQPRNLPPWCLICASDSVAFERPSVKGGLIIESLCEASSRCQLLSASSIARVA